MVDECELVVTYLMVGDEDEWLGVGAGWMSVSKW